MLEESKKRGQVTIFIIIGVLIVAMVALFFILKGGMEKKGPSIPESINPENFLKTCMEDLVKETIETLSYQGGYLEPELKIEFMFMEDQKKYDIAYLCYTRAQLVTCDTIQPMLIKHLEKEIKNKLSKEGEIEYCFKQALADIYGEMGYDVDLDYKDFEADLVDNKLIIRLLDSELNLIKEEETLRKKDLEIDFSTKLYNNALVANDIIIQQAEFCNFDRLGYMSLYPEFKIKQTNAPNESWIYTIENLETNEKFRLAVRSCVPV